MPNSGGGVNGGEAKFAAGRVTQEEDAAYLDAVRRGDMEAAQRLLKSAWERSGYSDDTSYKDAHAAPCAPVEAKDFRNVEALTEARDEGWDLNLWAVAKGITGQPDDFFSGSGPRLYGYDDAAGREAQEAVAQTIDLIRAGVDNAKIIVYRAVPKPVKLDTLQSGGQWVSPSRTYAENHGKSRFGFGKYRVIREAVRADELWWDGNDAREWGYDDGRQYVYMNDKNGKKLATVTYDGSGNVIPLSERFNRAKGDVRFHVARGEDALKELRPVVTHRVASSYAEARTVLAPQVGKTFRNRETGVEATLSNNSVNKLLSGKAVAKSVGVKEHLAAVANVSDLFENGRLLATDEGSRKGVLSAKRFFSRFTYNGEDLVAKTTVLEYERGDHRIYSVEAMEVEKAGSILAPKGSTNQAENPALPSTPRIVPQSGGLAQGGAADARLQAGEAVAMDAVEVVYDPRAQVLPGGVRVAADAGRGERTPGGLASSRELAAQHTTPLSRLLSGEIEVGLRRAGVGTVRPDVDCDGLAACYHAASCATIRGMDCSDLSALAACGCPWPVTREDFEARTKPVGFLASHPLVSLLILAAVAVASVWIASAYL